MQRCPICNGPVTNGARITRTDDGWRTSDETNPAVEGVFYACRTCAKALIAEPDSLVEKGTTAVIGHKVAAAKLVERHLRQAGQVIQVGSRQNIVGFTTSGDGYHLMNVHGDFDADVHLVCEPKDIEQGPLDGEIDPEAKVYANFVVHGLADEPTGYALPMYAPKKDGVVVKDSDDVDPVVWSLGRIAGLDLSRDDDEPVNLLGAGRTTAGP